MFVYQIGNCSHKNILSRRGLGISYIKFILDRHQIYVSVHRKNSFNFHIFGFYNIDKFLLSKKR